MLTSAFRRLEVKISPSTRTSACSRAISLKSHSFARQAGIETVIASATPEQKVDCIRELKQQGKTVVMVGDGVNDAPALAIADVSITLPSATDAARESAGVVLNADRLTAVPLALRLAKDVIRNIRGNLLWALCNNLLCIPLAACGVMNPSIASAAMSFSSIAVLMHALRLKKPKRRRNAEWKPPSMKCPYPA